MDGQAGITIRRVRGTLGLIIKAPFMDEEWWYPSDQVGHRNFDRPIHLGGGRYHVRIHPIALQALYDAVEE